MIAQRCNVEFDFSTYHLPEYKVPDGVSTKEDYLHSLIIEGMKKRYENLTDEIKKRVNYEFSVINKMGFTDYFLIVWDFVNFAKKNKIPVGPGRGSGANSIVAYCLEITDIDPIEYDLIFERFLNPERVSIFFLNYICNTRYIHFKDVSFYKTIITKLNSINFNIMINTGSYNSSYYRVHSRRISSTCKNSDFFQNIPPLIYIKTIFSKIVF